MKRPAAVTSAIVVLLVFTFISLVSFVAGLPKNAILMVLPGLCFLSIHLIPAIGMLRRKAWSRIFAIVIFILWALGFVFIGIYMMIKQHSWSGMIIEWMVSVLLSWQIIALFKTHVKTYFSSERELLNVP